MPAAAGKHERATSSSANLCTSFIYLTSDFCFSNFGSSNQYSSHCYSSNSHSSNQHPSNSCSNFRLR